MRLRPEAFWQCPQTRKWKLESDTLHGLAAVKNRLERGDSHHVQLPLQASRYGLLFFVASVIGIRK